MRAIPSKAMRTVFHQQLDDLNVGIAQFCDRTGAAMALHLSIAET